jgi:undecaprenyl-diphosphatase
MPITALQYLILGIIQGITEWLPVSSSAFIILVMSNFFKVTDANFLLQSALFLHLGTFFAALIYFKKDAWELFKTIFKYKKTKDDELVLFNFILVSTIVTAFIGIIILTLLSFYNLELTGKTISFFVGSLLLITGIFQVKTSRNKKIGLRKEKDLENKDSFLLGIVQGLSTLPGLSRSGITVSTLLLRKFDDTEALKLSFLMSLPVVLLGNIIINSKEIINFSSGAVYGLLASFIFGLATIHGLMKLSKKINFGWFIIIFAVLMIASILI